MDIKRISIVVVILSIILFTLISLLAIWILLVITNLFGNH
jgi:hypothetical protein